MGGWDIGEPQAAGILLGVVPGPGTSTAFVRSAHGTALGEEKEELRDAHGSVFGGE